MTAEEIFELLKKDAYNKGYRAVLQKTHDGIIEALNELQALRRQNQKPTSTDTQQTETPSQPDQQV